MVPIQCSFGGPTSVRPSVTPNWTLLEPWEERPSYRYLRGGTVSRWVLLRSPERSSGPTDVRPFVRQIGHYCSPVEGEPSYSYYRGGSTSAPKSRRLLSHRENLFSGGSYPILNSIDVRSSAKMGIIPVLGGTAILQVFDRRNSARWVLTALGGNLVPP